MEDVGNCDMILVGGGGGGVLAKFGDFGFSEHFLFK